MQSRVTFRNARLPNVASSPAQACGKFPHFVHGIFRFLQKLPASFTRKMPSSKRLILLSACAFSIWSPLANAQFGGILNGVMSVVNQVSGKIGANVTGANQLHDVQAEREKYFSQLEAQTAGMDPASRKQFAASMEAAWSSAEDALLMSNAQSQRANAAPLVDFEQVANATLGGLATQVSMNSVFGGSSLASVMQSATLEGAIDGLRGTSNSGTIAAQRASALGAASGNIGAVATAGVTAGAANAVSGAVGSMVGGLFGSTGTGAATKFDAGAENHPLEFFGKHPIQLLAQDLYRENGYLGWKRIEGSTALGAEAYAPITGQGTTRAAVFNWDKATGQVNVAFRVISVAPTEFGNVVQAYAELLQSPPRYASSGSMVRAVWESGAFVTTDGQQVSAGWSHLVPAAFAQAPALPAVAK